MLVEANAYQYDSVHEKAAQGAEKEYRNNALKPPTYIFFWNQSIMDHNTNAGYIISSNCCLDNMNR